MSAFGRLFQPLRRLAGALLGGFQDGPLGSSRPIPPELWATTLQDFPFLQRYTPAELEDLRTLAAAFLAEKEFTGAGGFEITDRIAVAIAAQACLPVLRRGLSGYRGFVGIVVHDGPVLARRQWVDADGVAHEGDEELAGEALDGGPVMLCWSEVSAVGGDTTTSQPTGPAYNVVIHEFIHVLDAGDGEPDGVPALPAGHRHRWREALQAAYDRTDERIVCGHDSVVDPYGLSSPGEFFAVSAEAFFTRGTELRDELPELYALYAEYFGLTPR